MIDQKEAFEIIEKARKYKKSSWVFLRQSGCDNRTAKRFIKAYKNQKNPTSNFKSKSNIIYSENDQTATVESGQIKDVDTLLKEAKVDLNIWSLDHFIVNKWENASKDLNNKIQVTPLWQIKVWLKKKENADTAKELIEWFKDEIGGAVPKDKWDKIKLLKQDTKQNYCLEICIFDLHLGKLVWGEETGAENYDSNEAVRVFKLAVDDLIAKAPLNKIEKILLPIGQDFFNVDGSDGMTTAGTKQDEDSRWQNTFKKGCKLLNETITKLASYCQVECFVVPGNHDTERSFYLGEVLAADFKSHPNVNINNTPTLRKYYRYGQTLIGWTHGDKEAKGTLPLLLATERKDDWANCLFKEFHIGHLHSEIDKEIMGVKVRTISSLTSPDAWHAAKGYIGQIRQAKAFLYHFDKGLEAQYYFTL